VRNLDPEWIVNLALLLFHLVLSCGGLAQLHKMLKLCYVIHVSASPASQPTMANRTAPQSSNLLLTTYVPLTATPIHLAIALLPSTSMRYALCAMRYALCAMRYALCAMRYAKEDPNTPAGPNSSCRLLYGDSRGPDLTLIPPIHCAIVAAPPQPHVCMRRSHTHSHKA
jgi:hypothetical protein